MCLVATGRLDFDHFGVEVGEDHVVGGIYYYVGEFEYVDVGKG